MKSQKYTAVCVVKEKVSAKVYVADFAIRESGGMPHAAGHTIMLMLADGVHRSMSLASAGAQSEKFTLAYDVSPGGPGSRWMINLRVGETVSFVGPLGAFLLDSESRRKKVFVATGTGIAPFRAMIEDWSATGNGGEISLYWGLRHDEDVFWQEYFQKVAQASSNFHFLLTLSQATPAWSGERGRVTDHLFKLESNLQNNEYYLCGNTPMVKEVYERLQAREVPQAQIKRELFF